MNRNYLDDFFAISEDEIREKNKKKEDDDEKKEKRKDDVEDVPSFVNYSWWISLVDRLEKSLHMSLSAIR